MARAGWRRGALALAFAFALALAGCGARAARPPVIAAPVAPPPAIRAVDPAAALPVTHAEVVLTAGGRRVPGSIVAPAAPGRWPAVVLLAGSGPTDRDWNSPLLAATNGSGRLLAEALAARGVVVVRFDKAGSGANPGPPLAAWTIDSYRDEVLAALAHVRARPDVRADRVFLAGHSEGGIHATRAALAAGADIAGVLYLAPASRSMAETMLTQLEAQLRGPQAGLAPAQVEREVASLRAALAAIVAGRPVDPARASTIPQLRQLIASLAAPATAPLTAGLLGFDNATAAAALTVPALVIAGGKDVQIDPDLDARRLADALRAAGKDVTLHVAPDADHVLKHQPADPAALRADLVATQNGYNAAERALDADVLAAVVAWLAARTR